MNTSAKEKFAAGSTFEARQRLLDGNMHLALLRGGAQIGIVQGCRVFLTSLLGERENHHWEEFLLAEVP